MFKYTVDDIEIIVDPGDDCRGWISFNETITSITDEEKLICEQYDGKKRLFEICYYLYWHMIELKIPEEKRKIICFPLENAEIVKDLDYQAFMKELEDAEKKDKENLEKALLESSIIIEEKINAEDGQYLLF